MSLTPPQVAPPVTGEWATKPTTAADLLAHPEGTVPAWSATEPNAAGVIGVSRSTAYSLVRRDEFPVPVIRAGKHLRVSVAALLDFARGDRVSGLSDYVERFAVEIIGDALRQADAQCWERRAERFEADRPKPGDFLGRSGIEGAARLDAALAARAEACRMRADATRRGWHA